MRHRRDALRIPPRGNPRQLGGTGSGGSRQSEAGGTIGIASRLIDEVNPRLNAVIGRIDAVADEALAHPKPGPFSGVPFLIKDIGMHYADIPHGPAW